MISLYYTFDAPHRALPFTLPTRAPNLVGKRSKDSLYISERAEVSGGEYGFGVYPRALRSSCRTK